MKMMYLELTPQEAQVLRMAVSREIDYQNFDCLELFTNLLTDEKRRGNTSIATLSLRITETKQAIEHLESFHTQLDDYLQDNQS